jgi:hypothetical protein
VARTELPWLVWGRQVRPYALAVSLASANLFAVLATGKSAWATGDSWSWALATLAFLATVLLWVGWWTKRDTYMQHGLAMSAVVFAYRGAYIGLTTDTTAGWMTAGLSLCWTVASVGAWLLESTTGDRTSHVR